MRAYNNYNQQKYPSARSIYISRKVETSHRKVERLRRATEQQLGKVMVRKTYYPDEVPHVTMLGPGAPESLFRAARYNQMDIRGFSEDLKHHLARKKLGRERQVCVDPDEPLIWLGNKACSLALNLNDSALLDERGCIEEYLEAEFGELPDLSAFRPHMTLARVRPLSVTAEARSNPGLLLLQGVDLPACITLHGLAINLDFGLKAS